MEKRGKAKTPEIPGLMIVAVVVYFDLAGAAALMRRMRLLIGLEEINSS